MANSQDNMDKTSLAHDRVYKGLRLKIMYGQIQPGQSLTLRGIGESYGVSMTPSREAVRRLVAERPSFYARTDQRENRRTGGNEIFN